MNRRDKFSGFGFFMIAIVLLQIFGGIAMIAAIAYVIKWVTN